MSGWFFFLPRLPHRLQSKNILCKQLIFCNSTRLEKPVYILWAVYMLLLYNLLDSTENTCRSWKIFSLYLLIRMLLVQVEAEMKRSHACSKYSWEITFSLADAHTSFYWLEHACVPPNSVIAKLFNVALLALNWINK